MSSRKAGFNERRCIARDVQGLYGRIVILGTYEALDAVPDLGKTFAQALHTCIARHPALSVVVRDSKAAKPDLVQIGSVQISDHLHISTNADSDSEGLNAVKSLLLKVHNEFRTDYEVRPQWKVYVQPVARRPNVYHVAVATSHVLADGMSASNLHATLLAALRHSGSPDHATAALLPSIDQAKPLPLSWAFFLRTLATEFLPLSLKHWLGLAPVPMDVAYYGATKRPEIPQDARTIPTALVVAQIPASTLRDLLAACRQHKTRLTGLLNHVIARAIAHCLHKRGEVRTKYICETAIDLRRCVPSAQGQIANYSSAVNEVYTVEHSAELSGLTEADWTSIRTTTQRLLDASSSLVDQQVALLKYVSDISGWVTQRAKTRANGSFSVSNLGSFDGRQRLNGGTHTSSWSITDMLFSQSADGTGAPFNVNVASAFGGALNLTLTWWPGMLGVSDEEAFATDICSAIVRQAQDIAETVPEGRSE